MNCLTLLNQRELYCEFNSDYLRVLVGNVIGVEVVFICEKGEYD